MESMSSIKHETTTSFTIRNVEKRLKEHLRVRAAQHGRSMEAELRDILVHSLAEEPEPELNLAEATRRHFEPFGGVDLELPARGSTRELPNFES